MLAPWNNTKPEWVPYLFESKPYLAKVLPHARYWSREKQHRIEILVSVSMHYLCYLGIVVKSIKDTINNEVSKWQKEEIRQNMTEWFNW